MISNKFCFGMLIILMELIQVAVQGTKIAEWSELLLMDLSNVQP